MRMPVNGIRIAFRNHRALYLWPRADYGALEMKRRFSPTQKTLAYLKERGFPCEIVERYIIFGKGGAGIRRDVWGGDIQCICGDATFTIQAGVSSAHSTKIKKASELEKVRQWLSSSSRKFLIWTWGKRVAYTSKGKRCKKLRWTPRVTELVLMDGKIIPKPFALT